MLIRLTVFRWGGEVLTSGAKVNREIEELRRQLHKGLESGYDPARLQALAPISHELDRLAIELGRQELSSGKDAKR